MKDRTPWWDRLNNLLLPYIGPPELGPYDEPPLAPTGPEAVPGVRGADGCPTSSSAARVARRRASTARPAAR